VEACTPYARYGAVCCKAPHLCPVLSETLLYRMGDKPQQIPATLCHLEMGSMNLSQPYPCICYRTIVLPQIWPWSRILTKTTFRSYPQRRGVIHKSSRVIHRKATCGPVICCIGALRTACLLRHQIGGGVRIVWRIQIGKAPLPGAPLAILCQK